MRQSTSRTVAAPMVMPARCRLGDLAGRCGMAGDVAISTPMLATASRTRSAVMTVQLSGMRSAISSALEGCRRTVTASPPSCSSFSWGRDSPSFRRMWSTGLISSEGLTSPLAQIVSPTGCVSLLSRNLPAVSRMCASNMPSCQLSPCVTGPSRSVRYDPSPRSFSITPVGRRTNWS